MRLLVGIVMIGMSVCAIQTRACSVCRSGDTGFLFSEKSCDFASVTPGHRFWFSLNNVYSTKSNAHHHEHDDMDMGAEGTERMREFRPSARVSFIASSHLSLAAELPIQFRRIEMTMANETSRETSSGIGDAELSAVWMQPLWNKNGKHIAAGISVLSKLPTGSNTMEKDGERLDEHLQAGTGTFDWQFGAALSRSTAMSLLFLSTYYRVNGKNDFEYQYGDVLLFNIGAQRSLFQSLLGTMQINSRYAQHDLEDTHFVDHTGGWVVYATPGVKLNLTPAVGVSTSIQIPVYQDLYGTQSEKTVISTGLSYQF